MSISIRWFDGSNSKWVPFNISDIEHHSVDHALCLFGRSNIQTEAVDGDRYIVSTPQQFSQLKRTGKKVFSFKQMFADGGKHLCRPLGVSGFFGDLP